MKIRNIIVGAACVAAWFAAVAFSGCSGGHTVTVMELTNGALSGEEYSVRVDDGEKFTWDALLEEYPGLKNNDTGFMRDGAFYTDDDCLVKYTAEVTSDIALYFGNYSPAEYGKVVFNYGDGEYTVYRKYGAELSAADFSRSAYGFGEAGDYLFYEDAAHSQSLDISSVTVSSVGGQELVIYVADA